MTEIKENMGEGYESWKAPTNEAPSDDPGAMPKPTKPQFVGRQNGEALDDKSRDLKLQNYSREIAAYLMSNFRLEHPNLTQQQESDLSILRDGITAANAANPNVSFDKAFEAAAGYMEMIDPVGGEKFRQEYHNEILDTRGR